MRWYPRSPYSRLADAIAIVIAQQDSIMATLADITAAVAAERTVEDSIVTLLGTLSADLKAAIAANDPAAMQAVVDTIDANKKVLSDAITTNTPAAPAV
jgi:hypothetical protein